MKLEEHIHIIQALPIHSKANVIKILWHFLREHADFSSMNPDDKHPITLDDLLKRIYPPRPPESWKEGSKPYIPPEDIEGLESPIQPVALAPSRKPKYTPRQGKARSQRRKPTE